MISRTTGAVAAALLISAGAHAAPFTGSDVGSWQNLQGAPGATYTITNNDAGGIASFDFGTAAAGSYSNLFTFNGVGSDGAPGFNEAAEKPFSIGHFTYRNGTTTSNSFPSTGATIDLGIALTLTSPAMVNSSFNYDFSIDLTPNTTGNPVLDGDIVGITAGTTSKTFTVGGTVYTLALKGFSQDGGATYTTQFNSPEQTTAAADIYAVFTTKLLTVPEPGSLALLAAGLAGAGLLRRKAAR